MEDNKQEMTSQIREYQVMKQEVEQKFIFSILVFGENATQVCQVVEFKCQIPFFY